jgi:sec-independent protein translocase protein TatC
MNHQERSPRPFGEHLLELRNRSFIVLASVTIGSIIGYQFYGLLLKVLLAPLHQAVYYTSPVGGFNFSLQLSILFGMFVAFPVLMYHLLRFAAPALPSSVERRVLPLMVGSIVLMLLGVSFSYFIGLPTALHFLAGFSSGDIHSLISANDYFTFATRYLFGFGLLFQLPIVLIIINFVRPLNARMLFAYQRHAIIGAFVIAIFLSPAADPLNMTLMALPLIGLYFISVFFVLLLNRGRGKHAVTGAALDQELSRPVSVYSSVGYFIVIALVSALFGMAFLFSYATYDNIQRYHIPLNRVLVMPPQR